MSEMSPQDYAERERAKWIDAMREQAVIVNVDYMVSTLLVGLVIGAAVSWIAASIHYAGIGG